LDKVEKAQDKRDDEYSRDPKQIGLTGDVALRCNDGACLPSRRRLFVEPPRALFHSRRSVPASI